MVLLTARSRQTPPLHLFIPARGTDFGAHFQMLPQSIIVGAALEIGQDLGLR
jgi:hypothetical protein